MAQRQFSRPIAIVQVFYATQNLEGRFNLRVRFFERNLDIYCACSKRGVGPEGTKMEKLRLSARKQRRQNIEGRIAEERDKGSNAEVTTSPRSRGRNGTEGYTNISHLSE